MRITHVELENFKKIGKAAIELGKITVLVGANDSGKSSFVQGMHFALMAANAYYMQNKKTFPQERLLYCPTVPFYRLSNKFEYGNRQNFLELRLAFDDDGKRLDQEIKIYRARNDNVGFEYVKSHADVTRLLQSTKTLFSVYVPGVAGIGRSEPLHQKGQIKRGIASGDANLYLRSVVYRVFHEKKLELLKSLVKKVFPNFFIKCTFDEENDADVSIEISTAIGGIPTVPIELAATGVLQVLQLFAYATLFEPKILLLDEPDSHIHPDRQQTLARALVELTANSDIQVILTTHSKHLMSALQSDARFYAFNKGAATILADDATWIGLLADLGIVSQLETLRGEAVDYLILTEDTESVLLKSLLVSNGANLDRCLFSSYQTSSQLQSARMLARWVKQQFPKCRVIIHRDRDFLTDDEINHLCGPHDEADFFWFVTHGSDIESYFIAPDVVAELTGKSVAECEAVIESIAVEANNALVEKFTNKRTEASNLLKTMLGKNNKLPQPPKLSTAVPLPVEQRLGKAIYKLLLAKLPAAQKRLCPASAINVALLARPEIQKIFDQE